MTVIFNFILWTLVLYTCHRLAHSLPFLWYYHQDHHVQISMATNKGHHWSNYFLFFDSWKSTIDQWLIEIIPTIVLCLVLQDFFLLLFYYVWAVFIQEKIEHDINFNFFPFLTSGKWHMVHHNYCDKNYGVFIFFWDWLFGTYRKE